MQARAQQTQTGEQMTTGRAVKRSIYYHARLIKGDAQRERKKSRVCHVMTPRSLVAPKSCAFGETLKMCVIDSTP